MVSSTYSNPNLKEAKALVDGKFQTTKQDPFRGFATENEENPWIQIDLEESYIIEEVRVRLKDYDYVMISCRSQPDPPQLSADPSY
jgi:hypothetical protein